MGLKAPRRYNKTPSRRKVQGVGAQTIRGRRTPINVNDTAVSGTGVDVTFDQTVILQGIPHYKSANNHYPTGAVQDQDGIVNLEYGVTPTLPITIEFEDPAVRNKAGGYVIPGAYGGGG